MTDRYAVIGNPIAHSRSPAIHAAFARQTGQDIDYSRLLAPLDGFPATALTFFGEGGRGANVTVPFKEAAFRLATHATARATLAEAANTLSFSGGELLADNTDGPGLVRDLVHNLGAQLQRKRILLMGAGGAARGVLPALMAEDPLYLVVANRTASRAETLRDHFRPLGIIEASDYADLRGLKFDLVINATSASLAGEVPPLPAGLFAAGSLAYDMVYGAAPTPFMLAAREAGASRWIDGLGMLVEQAALSFALWRDVRPDTAPVLAALRTELAHTQA